MKNGLITALTVSVVMFLLHAPIQRFFNDTLPYLMMDAPSRQIQDYVRDNFLPEFRLESAKYERDFLARDSIAIVLKYMNELPEERQLTAYNVENWAKIDGYKNKEMQVLGKIYKVRGVANGKRADFRIAVCDSETGEMYIEEM